MSQSDIAAVILAAGKGTRMKSDTHKVLHKVGGQPMLLHLLDSVGTLNPARQILVVGAGREQVAAAVPSAEIVTQEEQHGTGHAVMVCRT